MPDVTRCTDRDCRFREVRGKRWDSHPKTLCASDLTVEEFAPVAEAIWDRAYADFTAEWGWLIRERQVGRIDFREQEEDDRPSYASDEEQIDGQKQLRVWPHEPRRKWRKRELTVYQAGTIGDTQVGPPTINAVVSKVWGSSKHMPLFDLDVPCALVPSSTPGHYHLYVQKELTPREYEAALRGLVEAGLVQAGYADQLRHDGFCILRLPTESKETPSADPADPLPLL